jgi:hypothetical protein
MKESNQKRDAVSTGFLPSAIQARIAHLRGWKAAFTWAIFLTTLMRLALGGISAIAWGLSRDWLSPVIQANLEMVGRTPLYKNFWFDIFFGAWIRWDAVNYLNIAKQGYENCQPLCSTFYPLYPALTRWVAVLMADEYELAGLLIATTCAIAALAIFYKMVEDELGAKSAQWTVIALSIFPTAFFLIAPFTESLFLTLTLGAFYLARRKQWLWVGILGACASLTRGPGIYTSAVLAWLAWKQYRQGQLASWSSKAKVLVSLTLPVAGGLSFIAWRSWVGFAPLNVVLLEQYKIVMGNPLTAIWLQLRQMVILPWFTTWLDGASMLIALGLLAVMLINSRWRRGEWILYMGLNLVTCLSKHCSSGQSSTLQSMARYSLVLFPCFIIVGEWLSRQGKRTRFWYLAINEILLLFAAAMNAMNVFIG